MGACRAAWTHLAARDLEVLGLRLTSCVALVFVSGVCPSHFTSWSLELNGNDRARGRWMQVDYRTKASVQVEGNVNVVTEGSLQRH